MKLNKDDVLGSFDGFMSHIKIGKNIRSGMLIYTRLHEDAHRIFQSSTEMGWIIYFLKKDCEIAAENRDFEYCNRITAFVNVLEKFMENISEIFANTCELLAVKENGLDVKDYIKKCKKGEYKKYCFLFDYVNCLEGSFYDKIGTLLNASSKAMQKYDTDYVKIGLEGEISKLKEQLLSCEVPEVALQRILYGEISYEKKEIEFNNIIDVLEGAGTLTYLKDFVSLVRTTWFEEFVDDILENKELLNLKFHESAAYFLWNEIKCQDVSVNNFVSRETDFVAIYSNQAEECVVYKYFGNKEVIKCCLDIDELDLLLDTVKYVMYEKGKSRKVDEILSLRKDLVLVIFYDKMEDYLKEVFLLNKKARFVTISDSKDYVVSFGMLISKLASKELHFSVFNGLFSRILYQLVEALGGETFYSEEMFDCFETEDLKFAYCHAMLFCLEATT